SESERELAALTNRRDSINAQLTNVREMLATLTGAAVAAAGTPSTDDEPISRGVPAQQSR
ncbi:cellulose-binding protein, partial [Streptomyces sp. NPDC052015]